MKTILDTISDKIFEQKEILKMYEGEINGLVDKLASKNNQKKLTKEYLGKLEAEHKELSNRYYNEINKFAGSNPDAEVAKIVRDNCFDPRLSSQSGNV